MDSGSGLGDKVGFARVFVQTDEVAPRQDDVACLVSAEYQNFPSTQPITTPQRCDFLIMVFPLTIFSTGRGKR